MIVGTLVDMTISRTGKQRVTFETDQDIAELFDSLVDKPVEIGMKQHREHRSLDANAYAWVLIDRIASVQGLTKEEVYREAIRSIGGVSTTLCLQTKAVQRFCSMWRSKGVGWHTDVMPSKLPECTNVVAYYGSSVYDTKQMSDLIDALVQDAQALGIETRTPEQIEKLKAEWKEYAA